MGNVDLHLLLAVARFNSQDVKDLYEYITAVSEDEFLRDFRHAQRALREASTLRQSPTRPSELLGDTSLVRTRHDIIRLLDSAKLGPREAAPALTSSLLNMGAISDPEALKFNPKEGFSRWFERAYRLVGGSSLLKAAIVVTSAINDTDTKPDWTLKGT